MRSPPPVKSAPTHPVPLSPSLAYLLPTPHPCMYRAALACGNGEDYTFAEDRFFSTRMTHKQFRSSISKKDSSARRQFNNAAAVEARLRAVQLLQTLATESACAESGSDVHSALDRLAEDQYEQHLKLMQRTNSHYQRHQKLIQDSLEAELPPPPSPLPPAEPADDSDSPFVYYAPPPPCARQVGFVVAAGGDLAHEATAAMMA